MFKCLMCAGARHWSGIEHRRSGARPCIDVNIDNGIALFTVARPIFQRSTYPAKDHLVKISADSVKLPYLGQLKTHNIAQI